MTFLSDSPIYDNDDDKLGRKKFIDSLKRIIFQVDSSNESFVLGVSGKRGEGKISIPKMLENKIKNNIKGFLI